MNPGQTNQTHLEKSNREVLVNLGSDPKPMTNNP